MGDHKSTPYSESTGKDRVILRPAQDGDLSGIKSVWRDAFGDNFIGDEKAFDAFLDWAYTNNPDRNKTSTLQWVATQDGDVVAAWATAPARFYANGELRQSCWLQNTAVASRAQRRGIGKRMFRAILAHTSPVLGVGVVPASRALYVSEGAHFIRADTFVERQISFSSTVKTFAAAIYRRQLSKAMPALRALKFRLFYRQKSDPAITTNRVDRFEKSIDPFIHDVTASIPVMMHRDAAKLNWFMNNPKLDVVAYTATREAAPCGYIVMRADGLVLDFLVRPDDSAAFDALLAQAKTICIENNIRQIKGIAPGFAKLSSMYERAGFIPADGVDFGLFYAHEDIQIKDPVLHNPKNWYLSMADSDLWSFQLNTR